MSDGIDSSWSGGTLPRGSTHGFRKVRKSPEGSYIVDSGFSTETKDTTITSTTGNGTGGRTSGNSSKILVPSHLDVRWDMWENGAVPQQQQNPSDELHNLLDAIHRKAVRLRGDIEARDTNVDTMTLLDPDSVRYKFPNNSNIANLGPISESGPSRSERDYLVGRIAELEAENAYSNARLGHLEGELRQKSDKDSSKQEDIQGSQKPKTAAIVHSVQIRTDGNGKREPAAAGMDQHQVNIEIKQKHRNSQLLLPNASKSNALSGVSVVNLRGSVDNFLPHFNDGGPARHRTNSFGRSGSSTLPSRPKMIPGRIVVPPPGGGREHRLAEPPHLNRVISKRNLNPKSRSVENLFDGQAVLGLKNANSEMNMLRQHGGSTKLLAGSSARFMSSKMQVKYLSICP